MIMNDIIASCQFTKYSDDVGDKVGDGGVFNFDRPPQPDVLCSRSPARCSSCL